MEIERAIEILDPNHREQYDSLETVQEACRMGMEALKKQEPVKPQKMLGGSWQYMRCGACEKVLYEQGFAYCPWCGRKVKWDG